MRFVSLETVQKYLYLLLLLLLPTQFGKHFWPSSAFVNGLRIDYLSPTLYTTDVLILSLFVIFVYQKHGIPLPHFVKEKKIQLLVISFIAIVFVGVFFAKNQPVAFYGIGKLWEMTFFAAYSVRVLGKTISFKTAAYALGAGLLLESGLAIAQFFSRGSIGGIWYFLGERAFHMGTPGIANASIHGQLILRPYGTLPHPNVLAGFLLITIIFLLSLWQQYAQKEKIAAFFVCAISCFALFLSLSRITIGLFFIIMFIAWSMYLRKRRKQASLLFFSMLGIVVIVGVFFATPLLGRFQSTSLFEQSLLIRQDLLYNAIWVIQNHPLFGVGLLNFIGSLPHHSQTLSYFQYFQPVHNMYLLVASEIGIIGFALVLLFFYATIQKVRNAAKTPLRTACFFMLASILVLGFFDHYFITLQQGQLLFAFVIGVCFALPQEKKTAKAKKKRV